MVAVIALVRVLSLEPLDSWVTSGTRDHFLSHDHDCSTVAGPDHGRVASHPQGHHQGEGLPCVRGMGPWPHDLNLTVMTPVHVSPQGHICELLKRENNKISKTVYKQIYSLQFNKY